MSGFGPALEQHPWRTLLTAAAVIFVVQLLTLRLDPVLYQDEVQIIDFGRTVLNPSTEWALSWNVQAFVPVLPLSYVSAAIQEFAYRLGDGSNLFPRLSTLLGAVLAAICCYGWLAARRTPVRVAILLAVLFLLDPVFSDSYRQGRVDGLAIAACLGACWLARAAEWQRAAGKAGRHPLFWAGMLIAISPILWVTALVLFPLFVLELLHATKSSWHNVPVPKGVYGGLSSIAPVAAGGAVALVLISIPLLAEWSAYSQGLQTAAEIQLHAAVVQNSIVDLFLVHGPGLAVLVLVSSLVTRELGLFIALAVAVLMILQTMVYLPRVLYLIPYLLAIVASAAVRAQAEGLTIRRRLLSTLLGVVLLASACWILVLRPYSTLQMWPANEPNQFRDHFESVIGHGNYRVLLGVWEGYYAGRQLGWRLYRAGSPVAKQRYLEFVKTMDYVVTPADPSYTELSRARLADAGFETVARIEFATSASRWNGNWLVQREGGKPLYSDVLILRNMTSFLPESQQ